MAVKKAQLNKSIFMKIFRIICNLWIIQWHSIIQYIIQYCLLDTNLVCLKNELEENNIVCAVGL